MICADLEKLEGELDDIITELEKPGLSEDKRKDLEAAYSRVSKMITQHHQAGHAGSPCYEEYTE